LVSGGLADEGDDSLAALMAVSLKRDFGIAAEWQEDRSRNTAENARYSAEILRRVGIDRVVLVTHAWHMRRARAAFAAQKIDVVPAPTGFYGRSRQLNLGSLLPSTRALRMSGFAIHEILGMVWYHYHYGY
jgi:uncharacterized SAM-binding protein YcdF (DUF218 family)